MMSVQKQAFGQKIGMRSVLGLLVSLACSGAMALPTIDFGVAKSYSGFFFGDVNGATDVEGRLAVGGNLNRGFDIGYRNPHNSSAPTLVVQGNVSMSSEWGGNSGMVYNGPTYSTDTNASIGPSTGAWITQKTAIGNIVYGGSLSAASWQYGSATKNASFLDFAAAKTQLSGLSSQLAGQAQNGSWSFANGGISLVGDGSSNVQVFNLGNVGDIKNLSLSNIKAGAHIVINSSASKVTFGGNLGGDKANSADLLAQHRDRVVFNLGNATDVSVNTFLNGSVLAVNANLTGSGHLEGTVIAHSMGPSANGSKLELGYEPFVPTTPVPEPQTYAMLLAGLGVLGFLSRRRQRGG
jgi:choice-of-anchor A domain-containing protein